MSGWGPPLAGRCGDERTWRSGGSGPGALTPREVVYQGRASAGRSTNAGTFLERPIEGDWPYLWIEATYVKSREAGRIVFKAVIIAVAVNTEGRARSARHGDRSLRAEPFWNRFYAHSRGAECAG